MNPETLTTERKAAARAAIDEVLDAYPDVFGPACWCEGPDYCEGPCSTIPPTMHRAAWVLSAEFSDLDPTGKESVLWVFSDGCTTTRAVGMLTQGVRSFGG